VSAAEPKNDLGARLNAWAEGELERDAIQDVEQRQAETSSLIGRDFANMQPHLNDGYVVKDLLGTHSLGAIIGPTSSGKTFFAADLAMHIAAGKSWHGRRVRRGLTVYAALEGPVSAENRFVAARNAGKFPAAIPLRMTPGPINLRELGDQLMLIEFVRDAERTHGKCVAIFIDTLSRALAGGDENASSDMGALVKGADSVRQMSGATVILVHHLGKDENRGARGHSSLKAALDTEITLEAQDDGLRVATVTKQRDYPSGERFAFRLCSVDLGRDADGDAVMTCVVEHVDDAPPVVRPELRSKNQRQLVAALRTRSNADPDRIWTLPELRTVGAEIGLNKWTARRAVDAVIAAGYTQPSVGGHKFTDGVHLEQTGANGCNAPRCTSV
jgi:AAA domain